MGKVWIAVVVLAVLWVGVEVAAPAFAESEIESRVAERTEGATTAQADVESFPMVTRLAVTGKVKTISVRLDEIARQRLTFTDFTITLEGVELNRSALVNREVEVESIESGTVRAEIQSRFLAGIVGAISRFLGDDGLDVRVEDGNLFVTTPRTETTFDLPGDLFPCDADAEVREESIVISCDIEEVPPQFVKAANEG